MTEERVSSAHRNLYHYTGIRGLEGILNSNNMWATHFRCLNDRTELLAFDKFIKPRALRVVADTIDEGFRSGRLRVRPSAGTMSIKEIIAHQCGLIVGNMQTLTFGDNGIATPFILSFCTHTENSYESENGLLSQWRGYGRDQGVCIVFNTRNIESLLEHESSIFSHRFNFISYVTYDSDIPEVERRFDEVFKFLPDIVRAHTHDLDVDYTPILDAYIKGALLTKHRAFLEEQEIRVVVGPRFSGDPEYDLNDTESGFLKKEVKERIHNGKSIKYVEVCSTIANAVERVIIGPGSHQVEVARLVEKFSKLLRLEIDVIESETPLIW